MRDYGKKFCAGCGVEFQATSSRHKRCSLCARTVKVARTVKAVRAKRERNPELNKSKCKKWYRSNPDKVRRARLVQYGLTLEDYEALGNKQGGKCAVCGETPPDKKRLGVDHCHKTGKVRGLLCDKCNLSIGLLGDTYEGVLRALHYLKETEKSR